MSPTRHPRIRRDLTRMGLGIVQIATHAKTEREHIRRVALFDDLVEHGQVDVIRALLEKRVSWEELRDRQRKREHQSADILSKVALQRPFAEAITATLPRMGRATSTRDRYEDSLLALARQQLVPWAQAAPRVADLTALDWPALADAWVRPRAEGGAGKSAADWNRVVSAVSRFLSVYLADPERQPKGNKYAPFRLEVMARIEKLPEHERVPDLTPAVFRAIVLALPEHVQKMVYTLLLTGMRDRSEYLRATRAQLRPATCGVEVIDRKTRKVRVISVDPEFWPWIDAGIPAPIGYKALRAHWQRACLKVGAATMVDTGRTRRVRVGAHRGPLRAGEVPRYEDRPVLEYRGLWLHDLRHALGQWSSDAGAPLTEIKEQLRHSTLAMTERYSRTSATKRVARAVGDALRAETNPVTSTSPGAKRRKRKEA